MASNTCIAYPSQKPVCEVVVVFMHHRSFLAAVALCALVAGCSSDDRSGTKHHQGEQEGGPARPDGGEAPSPDASGTPIDGAPGSSTGGSDAGSVAAWPTDPPPAEPAPPTRTDDCDFGGNANSFVILAQDDIGQIAVDEKYAYFGTSSIDGCVLSHCGFNHLLKRVSRCGGTVESIAGNTDRIVLDGAGIAYWFDGTDLVRYTEADSSQQVIDHDTTCLELTVANASGFYAYSRCRGGFVFARTTDDALRSGPAYAPRPSALTATEALVYFSDAGGVGWWSPDTGARGRATTAGAAARALAVSPSGIFTMGYLDVSRIGEDGSVTMQAGPAVAVDFAVDNDSVSWATLSGVQTATGTGGAELAIERTVLGLEAYGGRLYWYQDSPAGTGPKYLITGKPTKAPVGASPPARAPMWEKRYGGSKDDELTRNVALDSAGNVFVLGSARAGTTDVGGGPIVIDHQDTPLLAKLDPSGKHLFSVAIQDGSVQQNPACLSVNESGASVVAFDDDTFDSANATIRAFTAGGDTLWSYAGSPDHVARACALTNSGDAWVTSDVNPASPKNNAGPALHLLHLDATGALSKDVKLGTIDKDETFVAQQLAISSSQDALALTGALKGSTDVGDGMRDSQDSASVLLTKLTADGTLVWSRLLRGAETSQVGFDGSGHVVVAGQTTTFVDFGSGPVWGPRAPETSTYVATFDATGKLVLSKIYDAGAAAFAVASDGTFVLGGYHGAYFPDAMAGVSFPDLQGSWFARFAADGTLTSAFSNSAMEYGVALAVSDTRLVVASGSATRGPSGIEDVQWDIGTYALP